jgi:hypothetical protein
MRLGTAMHSADRMDLSVQQYLRTKLCGKNTFGIPRPLTKGAVSLFTTFTQACLIPVCTTEVGAIYRTREGAVIVPACAAMKQN